MSVPTDSPSLLGREDSLARLSSLVDAVRAGAGGALRIEGAPGVGKSALLAAAAPDDVPVLRAVGVEAETGLPLAGLEELLHGLETVDAVTGSAAGLETVDAVTERAAGRDGRGVADGSPAPLTEAVEDQDPVALLREVSARLAAAAPVVCLIDDVQWLDPSSRAAVAYLARRATRLGIGVIAVWSLRGEAPEEWPGVETLALGELRREDALALARRGGLADPVAEALVAAVGGNALALVEAPAELSVAQRRGHAVLPDPLPAGERLQRGFAARVDELPEVTRDALLLAAAGAPATLSLGGGAAALGAGPEAATGSAGAPATPALGGDNDAELGAGPGSTAGPGSDRTPSAASLAAALAPAEDAGLVGLGPRGVAFSHPLVRAAVYHGAPPSARRDAHRRIAAAVPEPERSWQLAQAASSPDEELAARLERLGEEARRGGAPGTAATVLERSVALSPDPADATRRALQTAVAAGTAGRPALARGVLDAVLPTVTDPQARADVQMLRGMAIHQGGRPREAFALLEAEAAAIEERDPARASALLTQACIALIGTGPMAGLQEMAARARALAPPGGDAIPTLIGAEVLVSLGEHRQARELLDEVEPGLAGWDPTGPGHEVLAIDALCRLWMGDHDLAERTLTRLVEANRAAGAVTPLALPLAVLATLHIRRGDLALAAGCAEESSEIAETGLGGGFVASLSLAAVAMVAGHRGDAETCEPAAARMLRLGEEMELPSTLACAEQALGQLALGQGESERAAVHFRAALGHAATHGTRDPAFLFSHADLVEALVRLDRAEQARPVLADLEAGATMTGGAWPRAAVHRCRALLGPAAEIDANLAAALAAHAEPPMPFEAARTRLAIGERLRRARRRADARPLLAEARDAFVAAGARSWAARAASELGAAGGASRAGAAAPTSAISGPDSAAAERRTASADAPAGPGPAADPLTSRERDVCELVAAGHTNREVAATLFLSPRTVEHHLRAAYRKLGVRSRTELALRFAAGREAA
ncbi:MAG: AAA family ATPase [Actinobacteria bacterium]|nr:AAA family ATPase [Actinomycetota bacterium]